MAIYTSFPEEWPEQLFRGLAPFLQTRSAARTASDHAGVYPSVNLYDDGNAFLVRAEIPGIDKDSIEVTAKGAQLSIRGERRIEIPVGEASYHRRECEAGQFRRTITLPQPVDADAISASYKNGVLEVTLPRVAEVKPRKITIA